MGLNRLAHFEKIYKKSGVSLQKSGVSLQKSGVSLHKFIFLYSLYKAFNHKEFAD